MPTRCFEHAQLREGPETNLGHTGEVTSLSCLCVFPELEEVAEERKVLAYQLRQLPPDPDKQQKME